MSGFVNDPVLRLKGDSGWVLIEDLVYDSDVAGCRIIVPAGFETDLASVPRLPLIFWLMGDKARAAAIVHDWLYTLGKMPRSLADEVFKEACKATGVSSWRRALMWAGVRIGGSGSYNEQPE